MKKYLLMVYNPRGKLLRTLRDNPKRFQCAADGQWVIWNGPAIRDELFAAFQRLIPECEGAGVFVGGRTRGKCLISHGRFS